MSANYINPRLPEIVRGLQNSDDRPRSIDVTLKLAGDLIQDLIDLQASLAKPADEALDALYEAFQAHSRGVEFNEFDEHVCTECGEAFAWPEGENGVYNTSRRRKSRHIARAALRAALAERNE